MSDYKGARLIVDALPPAKWLLGDRRCDADWFRDALREKGIEACIPPKKNRKAKLNSMANSRIGGVLQLAMITHISQQSVLRQLSYSILINES